MVYAQAPENLKNVDAKFYNIGTLTQKVSQVEGEDDAFWVELVILGLKEEDNVKDAIVVDEIGEYIRLLTFQEGGGDTTFLLTKSSSDIDNPSVLWNEKNKTFKITGISLATNQWLNLKYKIKIDKNKSGFVNKEWYSVSKEAFLQEKDIKYDFPVPLLCGYEEIGVPVQSIWNEAEGCLNLILESHPDGFGSSYIIDCNTSKDLVIKLRKYDNEGHVINYTITKLPL